jgi:hypothetical protein
MRMRFSCFDCTAPLVVLRELGVEGMRGPARRALATRPKALVVLAPLDDTVPSARLRVADARLADRPRERRPLEPFKVTSGGSTVPSTRGDFLRQRLAPRRLCAVVLAHLFRRWRRRSGRAAMQASVPISDKVICVEVEPLVAVAFVADLLPAPRTVSERDATKNERELKMSNAPFCRSSPRSRAS